MAETALYTHNPLQFTLSIGAHIAGGYSDGSMITVELNADQVSLKVGVKGAGARSISQDQSGRITISLWPGSPTNDYLSQLADKDRKSSDGTETVQLKDLNGRTYGHTDAAWVVKKPTSDLQSEATARVWILETHSLEYFVGGEGTPD